MPEQDRNDVRLRLLPNQKKQLKATAKAHGQSIQGFIESLIMRAIAEEEERRTLPSEKEEHRPRLSEGPVSGLVEALRARQRDVSAPPQPTQAAPTQGQVVVNVGGGTGAFGGGEIDRLANFVASAKDDIERDKNLRIAVNILSATTPTDEERKVLAARLDEAIAMKTKAKPPEDENDLARAARVTFGKLAEFWKGM